MNPIYRVILLIFLSIPAGLFSFPLTNSANTVCIFEDTLSSTGTVEIQAGTTYTIAEDICAQQCIIGSSENSDYLLLHGYLGSILSGIQSSLFSVISYPKNNSQIDEITRIKGTANSAVNIDHILLTLKRMEDNQYFNGTTWQENTVWLTCTGKESWYYPIKKSVFDYNKYYLVTVKSYDVALNEENTPQHAAFQFIYKLTLEGSLINYPNPFFPSSGESDKNQTIMEYYLETSDTAIVEIYNINYELIKEFKENIQGKGLHHIIWDGKDKHGKIVPSGIYYLVIRAGGKKGITKIGVIR